LRLDDRPQVTYRPFEELRKELFTEVLSNKEKEMILAVKDELWKKYNVTPNQESIEQLIKSKTTGNVQVEAPVDTKQLRKPGEATDPQFVLKLKCRSARPRVMAVCLLRMPATASLELIVLEAPAHA
jgi:hypothetical protein